MPQLALVVAGFAMALFMPDPWAHWTASAALGGALFAYWITNGRKIRWYEGPGMLVCGVLVLAALAWLMPLDVLLRSDKLKAFDGNEAAYDMAIAGGASLLAGTLLTVSAALSAMLRHTGTDSR